MFSDSPVSRELLDDAPIHALTDVLDPARCVCVFIPARLPAAHSVVSDPRVDTHLDTLDHASLV